MNINSTIRTLPANSISTLMEDVDGVRLHIGDKCSTTMGEVQIKAFIAPDFGGFGACVRVHDAKGHRHDIRLRLSRAKLIRETSSRR